MDASTVLAVAGLILGPSSGVVAAAILSSRASKKNTETTAKISQQEANTHEFAELNEGLADAVRLATERLKTADERYDRLEARFEVLEKKYDVLTHEKNEIIAHVRVLEQGYPNPPGPPARPWASRK